MVQFLGRTIWRTSRFVLIVYLGVCLVLLFLENKLVFHPATAARDWEPKPTEEIVDVDLTSADGTNIHGWYYPAAQADQALLYLHGNAGNLSHRGQSIVLLSKVLGVSVLIIDYPGYGKSGGKPSESGCYLAADAAYDWLVVQQQFAGEKILLYGGSLGGGVAVDLASRKPHRALVLAKTFTSAPDVAASLYPWLPVRWLMANRFDNLTKIKQCHRPVFISHGDADTLIPHEQGQRLFAAANQPKFFLALPGSNHNDRLPREFFIELKSFLADHP